MHPNELRKRRLRVGEQSRHDRNDRCSASAAGLAVNGPDPHRQRLQPANQNRVAAAFGIEVNAASPIIVPMRLYLEGHVAWSSDYHEYFEIKRTRTERN